MKAGVLEALVAAGPAGETVGRVLMRRLPPCLGAARGQDLRWGVLGLTAAAAPRSKALAVAGKTGLDVSAWMGGRANGGTRFHCPVRPDRRLIIMSKTRRDLSHVMCLLDTDEVRLLTKPPIARAAKELHHLKFQTFDANVFSYDISPGRYPSEPDLHYVVDLLDALARNGFPHSPRLLRFRQVGQSKPTARLVEGNRFFYAVRRARTKPSRAVFRRQPERVAGAVALLHSQSPLPSIRKPRVWQFSLDVWGDEVARLKPMIGAHVGYEKRKRAMDRPEVPLLARFVELRTFIERRLRDCARRMPSLFAAHRGDKIHIHGDLQCSNMIFRENQLSCLVDFDNARYEYRGVDLIQLLFREMITDSVEARLTWGRQFLASYQAIVAGQLTVGEFDLIREATVLFALRTLFSGFECDHGWTASALDYFEWERRHGDEYAAGLRSAV